MKDYKTRKDRMAQFKYGVDWMDVVVAVCCGAVIILGPVILAYHIAFL
jgi:hypothetical protein